MKGYLFGTPDPTDLAAPKAGARHLSLCQTTTFVPLRTSTPASLRPCGFAFISSKTAGISTGDPLSESRDLPVHHVAAVDVDRLTGDLPGQRRRKKHDHRRDVLRCLPISQRYELLDLS